MKKDNKSKDYIIRFLDGIYTKEDARKVFDRIKEDEKENIFDEAMLEVWNESLMRTTSSASAHEAYKQEASILLQGLKMKPPSRRYFRRVLSIAASVVAIVSVLVGSYQYKRYMDIKNVSYSEVGTSFGETKKLTLPDGTFVVLNSQTQLTYPNKFLADERRITLIGEAYFQVEKKEKQAFVIETSQFDVKVLGTEFNIKAYKEDEIFSVSVEHGKVQIDMAEASLRLGSDEQIEINTLTREYSKRRDNIVVAVWRIGNLRFYKTPISEVAKELERVYNYKISFKLGQEFDNLITGEHTNRSLESVLKSIESTSGIKFDLDIDNKQVLLYK